MNEMNNRLDRLFRAAAQVKPQAQEPLPHYVEKAIISHWQLMRLPKPGLWDVDCFVPALAVAAVILLTVQIWQTIQPAPELTDGQFTLIAFYKLWPL